MTVFPNIIYNFAGNKNPITMKTLKILQNKCLVALMCIFLFPLCCMGQEKSERIVDDVIETFTEYEKGAVTYHYTTKEAKAARDQLLSRSETMDYNVIFPDGARRMGVSRSCRNCRDYIQNEILRRDNIKDRFVGKRICITMYSLPDGSVVLRSIDCRDNLLSILGPDGIKELVEIIQSYRFEQFNAQKNYHLGWFVTIFIPSK